MVSNILRLNTTSSSNSLLRYKKCTSLTRILSICLGSLAAVPMSMWAASLSSHLVRLCLTSDRLSSISARLFWSSSRLSAWSASPGHRSTVSNRNLDFILSQKYKQKSGLDEHFVTEIQIKEKSGLYEHFVIGIKGQVTKNLHYNYLTGSQKSSSKDNTSTCNLIYSVDGTDFCNIRNGWDISCWYLGCESDF